MRYNLSEMTDYINDHHPGEPGIAIVLGSGLGDFADGLDDASTIAYRDIPGYPKPTVEGHAGQLVFGRLDEIPLVCAKGRFHFYEGHDFNTVTLPIQLFAHLGVRALIITNAAGSTSRKLPPGTLMAIHGHMDGTFRHGIGDPQPVTGAPFHSPQLLALAHQAAGITKVELAEGVYCWTLGPGYETPEEIKYFSSLGADAVGMSTVPELQAAADLDIPALGISCLTNFAAGISDQPLTHDEVIETADRVKVQFADLLREMVRLAGAELNL